MASEASSLGSRVGRGGPVATRRAKTGCLRLPGGGGVLGKSRRRNCDPACPGRNLLEAKAYLGHFHVWVESLECTVDSSESDVLG